MKNYIPEEFKEFDLTHLYEPEPEVYLFDSETDEEPYQDDWNLFLNLED